jgi:hypothetical protein
VFPHAAKHTAATTIAARRIAMLLSVTPSGTPALAK